mgnify:CR=1 FL=1
MPTVALATCRAPGCAALGRSGWCEHHRPAPRIDTRPSRRLRGYDAAWYRLRSTIMRHRPLCSCGALATEIDHVVPLRAGGTHDLANLRAMCRSCHARKTARCDGGFGRARKG